MERLRLPMFVMEKVEMREGELEGRLFVVNEVLMLLELDWNWWKRPSSRDCKFW